MDIAKIHADLSGKSDEEVAQIFESFDAETQDALIQYAKNGQEPAPMTPDQVLEDMPLLPTPTEGLISDPLGGGRYAQFTEDVVQGAVGLANAGYDVGVNKIIKGFFLGQDDNYRIKRDETFAEIDDDPALTTKQKMLAKTNAERLLKVGAAVRQGWVSAPLSLNATRFGKIIALNGAINAAEETAGQFFDIAAKGENPLNPSNYSFGTIAGQGAFGAAVSGGLESVGKVGSKIVKLGANALEAEQIVEKGAKTLDSASEFYKKIKRQFEDVKSGNQVELDRLKKEMADSESILEAEKGSLLRELELGKSRLSDAYLISGAKLKTAKESIKTQITSKKSEVKEGLQQINSQFSAKIEQLKNAKGIDLDKRLDTAAKIFEETGAKVESKIRSLNTSLRPAISQRYTQVLENTEDIPITVLDEVNEMLKALDSPEITQAGGAATETVATIRSVLAKAFPNIPGVNTDQYLETITKNGGKMTPEIAHKLSSALGELRRRLITDGRTYDAAVTFGELDQKIKAKISTSVEGYSDVTGLYRSLIDLEDVSTMGLGREYSSGLAGKNRTNITRFMKEFAGEKVDEIVDVFKNGIESAPEETVIRNMIENSKAIQAVYQTIDLGKAVGGDMAKASDDLLELLDTTAKNYTSVESIKKLQKQFSEDIKNLPNAQRAEMLMDPDVRSILSWKDEKIEQLSKAAQANLESTQARLKTVEEKGTSLNLSKSREARVLQNRVQSEVNKIELRIQALREQFKDREDQIATALKSLEAKKVEAKRAAEDVARKVERTTTRMERFERTRAHNATSRAIANSLQTLGWSSPQPLKQAAFMGSAAVNVASSVGREGAVMAKKILDAADKRLQKSPAIVKGGIKRAWEITKRETVDFLDSLIGEDESDSLD